MDALSPTALALAALPDGVVLVDRTGRVCFVNRAAAALLVADVERLVGAPWAEVCAEFGLPLRGPARRQLVYRDYKRIEVRALDLPPEAARAGLSHGLLLALPTEEVRQLEDLISTISHEMRTPLTVIRGFSELLLRHVTPPLDDDQREIVGQIRNRAVDLTDLVNQVVTLADTVMWSTQLAPQAVDVAAMARRAEQRASARGRGWVVTCHVAPAAERLHAQAVEQLMERALLQLLEHACRETPAGGAITIAVRREGDRAVIALQDGGPGVPELFGRGARDVRACWQELSRRPLGHGGYLGLRIVAACLEGGALAATVASAEGAGTTFALSAPLA